MPRLFAVFFLLLLILPLLFSTAAEGAEESPEECLTCHEEMYVRAMSYPKMHTVVRDGCTKCHHMEAAEDKSVRMASAIFRNDIIFLLDDLTEEDKKHRIQINARDTDGNKTSPFIINTGDQETLKFKGAPYELKKISNIHIEKVEKKIFAKAVISWTTSVPTASTVKYGTSKKDRNVLTSRNIYSREHTAVLKGLRHKSRYTFTIASRDMNGKTLQSEERTFDTTRAFNISNIEAVPANDPDLKPGIVDAALLKVGKRKDVFIRISSNEPVEFKLKVSEVEGEETRPCSKFGPTRTTTIKVCTECHMQNASHPVGVRSKDPDITIPDELPVIENGVITCVTCHFAHGGETDYFLRVEFSKEICVKCHPKKYM